MFVLFWSFCCTRLWFRCILYHAGHDKLNFRLWSWKFTFSLLAHTLKLIKIYWKKLRSSSIWFWRSFQRFEKCLAWSNFTPKIFVPNLKLHIWILSGSMGYLIWNSNFKAQVLIYFYLFILLFLTYHVIASFHFFPIRESHFEIS